MKRAERSEFSDFDWDMDVDAAWAGLCISGIDDLVLLAVTWVYTQWWETQKHPPSGSSAGRRALLIRGQRKMSGMTSTDRKATETQISTRYNCGQQKCISGEPEFEAWVVAGSQNLKINEGMKKRGICFFQSSAACFRLGHITDQCCTSY